MGINPMQLQAMQMMQLNNQMNQMKIVQNHDKNSTESYVNKTI